MPTQENNRPSTMQPLARAVPVPAPDCSSQSLRHPGHRGGSTGPAVLPAKTSSVVRVVGPRHIEPIASTVEPAGRSWPASRRAARARATPRGRCHPPRGVRTTSISSSERLRRRGCRPHLRLLLRRSIDAVVVPMRPSATRAGSWPRRPVRAGHHVAVGVLDDGVATLQGGERGRDRARARWWPSSSAARPSRCARWRRALRAARSPRRTGRRAWSADRHHRPAAAHRAGAARGQRVSHHLAGAVAAQLDAAPSSAMSGTTSWRRRSGWRRGRRRRGRGWAVRLVPDRRDHQGPAPGDRPDQPLVEERQQVLDRATAPRDHDDVDLVVTIEPVELLDDVPPRAALVPCIAA